MDGGPKSEGRSHPMSSIPTSHLHAPPTPCVQPGVATLEQLLPGKVTPSRVPCGILGSPGPPAQLCRQMCSGSPVLCLAMLLPRPQKLFCVSAALGSGCRQGPGGGEGVRWRPDLPGIPPEAQLKRGCPSEPRPSPKSCPEQDLALLTIIVPKTPSHRKPI